MHTRRQHIAHAWTEREKRGRGGGGRDGGRGGEEVSDGACALFPFVVCSQRTPPACQLSAQVAQAARV
eukprot:3713275-Rhodomonas_salina.1